MTEKKSPQPKEEPSIWSNVGQAHCVICGTVKPQTAEAVELHEAYHKRKKDKVPKDDA